MSHPCVSSPRPAPQSSSTVPGSLISVWKFAHRLIVNSGIAFTFKMTGPGWLLFQPFLSDSPSLAAARCALIQKLPLSYLSKCYPRPQVTVRGLLPLLCCSQARGRGGPEGPWGTACPHQHPRGPVFGHPLASQQQPCPQVPWPVQFALGSSQFPREAAGGAVSLGN